MVATVYSWVAPVFFKVIAITIETKAFLMQSRKEMKKKQVRSQHFMLRAIASHIWCEIFLVLEAIFHACEGTIGRNGPEIAEKLVELKEVKLSAVVVCGTVRMAGYVFQGRLDVKM